MTSYGQFCPVAKAMELLDERWTLLVVRELLAGSTHFNDLRRGNPRMSPALLSKRLRTLERAGVVRRSVAAGRSSYRLTPAGEELRGVVEGLGAWGVRWIGELGEQDLDPHLLMWDIRRTIPVDAWPRGRTVVAFELDDVPARVARWWLCVTGDDIDVCDVDPGFEAAATVRSGLRTLVEIWRGDRSWAQAMRAEHVTVIGPGADDVPAWLGQMKLAAVPRPA
jgi:DNA-binding HxlR family transcriptional regulator